MRKYAFSFAVASLLLATAAYGQQGPTTAPAAATKAPTTMPAAGICPVSGAAGPAKDKASASVPGASGGTCPVSGASGAAGGMTGAGGQMPAGGVCPVSGATGTAGDANSMPPAMAQLMGKTPTTGPASTQPAGSASIGIQVVQGTTGAAKITGGTATVTLYRGHGIKPQPIQVKLDEHGVALLENLPLDRPFQPLVTFDHAGVTYEAVGQVMKPGYNHQKIDVPVYETTDKKPALTIQMRQVYALAMEGGLRVMDIMIVRNPGDRTWLGSAGPDGKPSTISVALPPEAKQIGPEDGFQGDSSRLADGKLISSAPVLPGVWKYSVSYLVPTQASKTSLDIDTPLPVAGAMVVMVPENQVGNFKVQGLAKGKTYRPRGNGMLMRVFMGMGIQPGQKISVSLTGTPPPPAGSAATQVEAASFWTTPKIAGVVVGAVLLVLCVALLLLKPARKPAEAEDAS